MRRKAVHRTALCGSLSLNEEDDVTTITICIVAVVALDLL